MDRRSAPELPERIRRQLPSDIERYMAPVGGVDLHVMERGQGQPVLMVHGNPTWGFLWRKVMAGLDPTRFRAIAPDLMGLGLSSRIRAQAHALDSHAAWIRRLITDLDLTDVILVVQDWGGPIGGLAFHGITERLAGVVVANTIIGPPRPDFKPTAFHRFAQTPVISELAFLGLGFPIGWLHTAQGDRSSIRGDVAWAYRWPLRRLSLRAAPLALARMVPDSLQHVSVEPLERVAEVYTSWKGPAAIVWGDKDPVLGRVRTHIERTLPQAKVWRSDAGHFLQEEVPTSFVEAIHHVARPVHP